MFKRLKKAWDFRKMPTAQVVLMNKFKLKFLIDIGANRTSCIERYVNQHLGDCGAEVVSFINNNNEIDLVKVNLEIAGSTFENLIIRKLKNNDFKGLLGTDVLSKFPQLTIIKNKASFMHEPFDIGENIPIKFENGLVFCWARVNSDSEGWFVLDTGANVCVLPCGANELQGEKHLKKNEFCIGGIKKKILCLYSSSLFDRLDVGCGVIGWNYFESLDFQLDWKSKTLLLR